MVRYYLAHASIQVVAVSPQVADGAIDAFDCFGKGHRSAGLSFGDCFACAWSYRMPLLFEENGFPLTDISAASNLVSASAVRAGRLSRTAPAPGPAASRSQGEA